GRARGTVGVGEHHRDRRQHEHAPELDDRGQLNGAAGAGRSVEGEARSDDLGHLVDRGAGPQPERLGAQSQQLPDEGKDEHHQGAEEGDGPHADGRLLLLRIGDARHGDDRRGAADGGPRGEDRGEGPGQPQALADPGGEEERGHHGEEHDADSNRSHVHHLPEAQPDTEEADGQPQHLLGREGDPRLEHGGKAQGVRQEAADEDGPDEGAEAGGPARDDGRRGTHPDREGDAGQIGAKQGGQTGSGSRRGRGGSGSRGRRHGEGRSEGGRGPPRRPAAKGSSEGFREGAPRGALFAFPFGVPGGGEGFSRGAVSGESFRAAGGSQGQPQPKEFTAMTCNASRAAVLPPRPLLTQLNGLPLLSRLFPLLLLAAALLLPGKAWSAEPTSPRAPAKGKLVFVTTTGLEDIGSLSSSLRHAKTAAESGLLSEVVWLSYGRSIVVLDPSLSAVPEN